MFSVSLSLINILIAIAGWAIRFFDKIDKEIDEPGIKDLKKWIKKNWITVSIQFISIFILLYLGPVIVQTGFGLCIKENSYFYGLYAFFVGYSNYALIKGCTNWLTGKTWFLNKKKE